MVPLVLSRPGRRLLMPTYDYQCKDCGHAFEAQQAFTDDALTECPSCGGALKKKFGSDENFDIIITIINNF